MFRRTLSALLLVATAAPLHGCGEKEDVPLPPRRPIRIGAGLDQNTVLPDGLRRKTVLTRSYKLGENTVNMHAEPFSLRRFDLEEPVWIVRWQSNTENEDGTRAPDDIHCHTIMANMPVVQEDSQLFLGLFTDGFVPRFVLPEGFAIRIDPSERIFFQPMFNNRRPTPRHARMRLEVDYLLDSERKRELVALQSFNISAHIPELYWIEPYETDTQSRIIEMPVTGRIHAIGAHLHPFGKSVELRRERDQKVQFIAVMDDDGPIEDQRLSTYSSTTGFFVRRGERYRITGVYENTSEERVDAMAGFFFLYDPKGKPDA